MTVVAEITVDLEDLPLGEVTSGEAEQTLEFERVVPAGAGVFPYLWVRGGDATSFEARARESQIIQDLTTLEYVDGDALYRVTWRSTVCSLLELVAEANGAVLHASGTNQWQLRLRFAKHQELAAFHARCRACGIPIQLERVSEIARSYHTRDAASLTAKQWEALHTALELGYFSIPRETSLTEIATTLDISQQSVSERIRRGTVTLLRSSLFAQAGQPPDQSGRDPREPIG